jgi:NAD(P)H-dependent FMN reductase
MTRVMALLGSLRAASVNRQLVDLAIAVTPDGLAVELFDRLGELPFYNQDVDNDHVAEPSGVRHTGAGCG